MLKYVVRRTELTASLSDSVISGCDIGMLNFFK